MVSWFQSTRPHGARPSSLASFGGCYHRFNPRARTGRDATPHCTPVTCYRRFQSTRPHGARRDKPCHRERVGRVSIHAPARGATCDDKCEPIVTLAVSIHAPARGATQTGRDLERDRNRFNPRARTGRDDYLETACLNHFLFQSTRPHGARPEYDDECPECNGKVSIHAPARGATHPLVHPLYPAISFNPRARTGRDLCH